MNGRKLRMLLLLVASLLLTLGVTVSGAAGGQTPSGGPAVQRDAPRDAGPLDLDSPTSILICLIDVYGFAWDMDGTYLGGGGHDFTGTVDAGTGWLWDATGSMTKYTDGHWETYWRADNPNADGCASGYTDYFEYTEGLGKKHQSGNWTSYCAGVPAGSGTWTATLTRGACGG